MRSNGREPVWECGPSSPAELGLARERAEAPNSPRGTESGPVSTPSHNRSGVTGGRIQTGSLRSPGGSGGSRGRRNRCIIRDCRLDQSETSAPPRNRLSPGGGQATGSAFWREGLRPADRGLGQAPRTPDPSPSPGTEPDLGGPHVYHEPRCDSLADDPDGPSPRWLSTLPGWPAVGLIIPVAASWSSKVQTLLCYVIILPTFGERPSNA